jgi:hypothetical protein
VEEKGRDQRDSRRSGAAAAARPRPRPEPRVPRGTLVPLSAEMLLLTPLLACTQAPCRHYPRALQHRYPLPDPTSPNPPPKPGELWSCLHHAAPTPHPSAACTRRGAASTVATAATDGWGAPQEDAGTTQESWAAPEPSTSTPAPGWGAKPAAAPAAGTGWGAPAPAAAAASSSWTGNFADRLKAGTAKPVAPPEPEPLPEVRTPVRRGAPDVPVLHLHLPCIKAGSMGNRRHNQHLGGCS